MHARFLIDIDGFLHLQLRYGLRAMLVLSVTVWRIHVYSNFAVSRETAVSSLGFSGSAIEQTRPLYYFL